jgi:hypothetical protein
MNGVIALVLVALGCFLILLGAYVSFRDWDKKHRLDMTTEGHSIDTDVGALTKLVVALKDYPVGQQLIVWGIVVLLIAGAWGGIASLGK